MAQIGLKNFYYAKLKKDDSTGVEYDVPKKITGLNSVDINPTVNKATLYGDDIPLATASTLSEIQVTIDIAILPLEDHAALLGHSVDSGTMVAKADDVAPYVAVMFESEKEDGSIRYVKLLKGKFSESQETLNTKGDNVDFQIPKIQSNFVARAYDRAWKKVADSSDSSMASTWYASVE